MNEDSDFAYSRRDRTRRGGHALSKAGRAQLMQALPDAEDVVRAAAERQVAERLAARKARMNHDELIDDAAQFKGSMTEAEEYRLLERVARNEPMRFVEIPKDSKLRRPTYNYRMLYPHPLSVDSACGESRLDNDVAMREINHLKADQRGWRAVVKNKPWCLEELYLTGFAINVPNNDGLTPLHLACHFGYIDCVKVFVGAQFDINAETTAGVTPLQSAIAAGHADVAEMLRAKGARKRITKQLSGRRTILDVASDRKGPCCVDELARVHGRPPYYMQF